MVFLFAFGCLFLRNIPEKYTELGPEEKQVRDNKTFVSGHINIMMYSRIVKKGLIYGDIFSMAHAKVAASVS